MAHVRVLLVAPAVHAERNLTVGRVGRSRWRTPGAKGYAARNSMIASRPENQVGSGGIANTASLASSSTIASTSARSHASTKPSTTRFSSPSSSERSVAC